MGENLAAEGRLAVRTPMQWSDDRNGGFSTARPGRLTAPVTEGAFGPTFVNVADQRRDPDSLLAFLTRLAGRYRECPELGWAPLRILDQPHDAVLALCSALDGEAVVTLHSFSAEPLEVPVTVDAVEDARLLVDLLDDGEVALDGRGRATVTLAPYGYRWLRVVGPTTTRLV